MAKAKKKVATGMLKDKSQPIISIILRYDLLNRQELKEAFFSAIEPEDRRQSARRQDAGRWEVLLCLSKAYLTNTPVVISDICVMSVSSESTVKRQLKELVYLGVIEKVPDENDRRRHFVVLKKTFRNALDRFVEDCDEEFKDLIDHHDNQERMQSQMALRETEGQLRAITDAMPDLVFLLDEDGRYIEIFSNTHELLIQEPSKLLGKTLHQVMPRKDADKFLNIIKLTLETDEPQSIEYSLPVPKGLIYFDGRTAPVKTSGEEKGQIIFVARDISYRKEAEFQLEESEKRFRDYTEMSVDWFWEMDEELRFSYFSSGIFKSIGVDKSFFLGKTRRELVANNHENEPQIKKHLEDLEAHREFENFVYCYKTPSEEERYARVSGNPLFNEDGKFLGYRGTTSDITNQIAAENLLRENLSFTEKIISHSPIGIGIYDSSGQCISANKSFAEIIGATPEQVLAQNYHDLESWKKCGLYDAALKATLNKIEIRHEVKVRSTFGKEIVLDAFLVLFVSKGEEHLLLMIHDETKRVQVEEALRESKKWLVKSARMIVHNLSEKNKDQQLELKKGKAELEESETRYMNIVEGTEDLITTVDEEGIFLFVNNRSTKFFGMPPEDCIGRLAFDFIHPEDRESTIMAFQKWLSEKATFVTYENRQVSLTGEVHSMLWNINLQYDDHGEIRAINSIARDITAMKQVEHELERARKTAEAASNAKSEFLATMSHDLRTPLNAIMGFSELMKEQTFGSLGDPHYEEYVTEILKSGKQLVSLINGVLDLSKIESGNYELTEEPLDIGALIREAVEVNATQAVTKRIEITDKLDPDIPMLYADERPVTQILNNLLSNAIKFTPENGRADVSAMVDEKGYLVVQIEDNGIGMSQNDIARATEPFDHAKSSKPKKHSGSGLGLYISSNLMALLGGTLDIDSEINRGTRITLRFPQERNVAN